MKVQGKVIKTLFNNLINHLSFFIAMKKAFLFFILIILLIPLASARSGSMQLLSVAETSEGMEGRLADLYLEIENGHGRVFIDTFPLTMMDTQISTRFANEVACDFINRDCSKVDFFYTIRSQSSLLGGPSAGASIAVLTISTIEKYDLDEKTAITGTINSGGIIGNVGGINEKIEAAANAGMKKILIPVQNKIYGNESINPVLHGQKLGVEVVEVWNLNQAVYEFTGKVIEEVENDIEIPSFYTETMKHISESICNKSIIYLETVSAENSTYEPIIKEANNLTLKAQVALDEGKLYSAASLCFGANIRYDHANMGQMNKSVNEVQEDLKELSINLDASFTMLDWYEIETITDLHAYMVVRERLLGVEEHITAVNALIEKDFFSALYQFAYAKERYSSALLWSEFLGKKGKKFDFSDEELEISCIKKISEAQERIEYLKFFALFPDLTSISNDIQKAIEDLEEEDYALCLFKASKAKAETDMIINAIGGVEGLVDSKLEAARKIISKNQKRGSFPLLGYSYFEYASTLKEDNIASSLLYFEYAIEMSNLDMYFGKKGKSFRLINYRDFVYVLFGALIGIIIYSKIFLRRRKIKP